MSLICPTVTPQSTDPHVYREQIERVSFAPRVQIDLMDGVFAPVKNTNPIQVWWPENMKADIHLMYERPAVQIETLVSLRPHLIILHAEADDGVLGLVEHIKRFGILAGVSLLQETSVASAHALIEAADHVLIFSGDLGHFGGTADPHLLDKVAEIRSIRPDIEIGWDGGVNADNVRQLADNGIDVLNAGGSIQRADDPRAAYDELCELIN